MATLENKWTRTREMKELETAWFNIKDKTLDWPACTYKGMFSTITCGRMTIVLTTDVSESVDFLKTKHYNVLLWLHGSSLICFSTFCCFSKHIVNPFVYQKYTKNIIKSISHVGLRTSPLPGDDVLSRGHGAGAVLNRRTLEQDTLAGTLAGLQRHWPHDTNNHISSIISITLTSER